MASFSKVGAVLLHSSQQSIAKSCLVQSVRFRRKPRWLPIAKSKEFYVREPTAIDQEEYDILKEKYKLYRAAMKSVRYYLKGQLAENKHDIEVQHDLDEAADYKLMQEQVLEWNKNIAVTRQLRQLEEMRVEKDRLAMNMDDVAQKRLQDSLTAEQRIQANKDASKRFVNEDNLDMEIEKMLDSRSDYNFALTKEGKLLEGEYPGQRSQST